MSCKPFYKGKQFNSLKELVKYLEEENKFSLNKSTFDKELAKKIQDKLQRLYPEIKLNITNNPVWEQGDNIFDQKQALENEVAYRLKSVDILMSDKAKQVFEKGEKAKWDLNKILTELQIPKEQKQLLLDLGITDREQLALELASKYGFSVEINTTKEKDSVIHKSGVEYFNLGEYDYYTVNGWEISYKKENIETGVKETITREEFDEASTKAGVKLTEKPTQYYSILTVPGGTNYTENEISTPLITPSIKGHAQFSTDKGIGWFRSDEQATAPTYKFGNFEIEETKEGKYILINKDKNSIINTYDTADEAQDYIINYRQNFVSGTPTKTRRILEIQSDWGQKQRKQPNPDMMINFNETKFLQDLQYAGDLKIECD